MCFYSDVSTRAGIYYPYIMFSHEVVSLPEHSMKENNIN